MPVVGRRYQATTYEAVTVDTSMINSVLYSEVTRCTKQSKISSPIQNLSIINEIVTIYKWWFLSDRTLGVASTETRRLLMDIYALEMVELRVDFFKT
jgi:hypothetical protein